MPTFVDLFVGGGLVRTAFGDRWECTLAVDVSRLKVSAYARGHSAAVRQGRMIVLETAREHIERTALLMAGPLGTVGGDRD